MREEIEEFTEVKKMILDAARSGRNQVKIFARLHPGNKRDLEWSGYEVEETRYQTGDWKTVVRW